MTLPSKSPETERLVEEMRARQRNTVWPDTMVNSSAVDAFLWKGSANPKLVQRFGAWIFGLTFVLLGVMMMSVFARPASDSGNWPGIFIGLAFAALGCKVFRNGFRRRSARTPTQSH
jgi:uncharacterized BrkB/YihY/UPF0761 family membrane protein